MKESFYPPTIKLFPVPALETTAFPIRGLIPSNTIRKWKGSSTKKGKSEETHRHKI